eukprot:GFUD01039770.1.p1 GENE.GFUD01039770.1~~GFUD01039770.1.p1  ORF type:complete len:1190 (+),score=295.95 GFUD01039770.1:88-3657(+)
MPSVLSHPLAPLAHYYQMVKKTILVYQDPVTGLLPAQQQGIGNEQHAWVRDNVYSITVVWALAMAYRRIQDVDEDQARTFLLEQATVKCMRGLLKAMMGQRAKVERFKSSFSCKDALHAKYSSVTGQPVVGDEEWGHLQIDATALYLLTLAQMTASGLQIIFTLDEVAFVQNLVFYIECAYVIPDYGIWERGDKSNQSIVELNSSSVGMAKAAMRAMNLLDLFGARGGPASVIHVLPDETVKCAAVLESMLPRESNSKETDASILSIIGYPAFAVSNDQLVGDTLGTLQEKLGGRYGMKRFLRDGYKTPRENTDRLHYEPWELRQFENIECEWPLFFCYLVIYYNFTGNVNQANAVSEILEGLTVEVDGVETLPEMYQVEERDVMVEYSSPGKSQRVAGGRCPFMWAQSLYIVGKLLQDGLLAPGELDPLNRRLSSVKKPNVVVQVVVLAEDARVQALLCREGVLVQTTAQISPIQVQPARMLSHLYTFLGRNRKLGLSGRRSLDVGILATSRVYKIQNKTFIFTPQSFDRSMNYTDTDPCLAMSTLAYALNYVSTKWTELGRPTVTIILSSHMVVEGVIPQSMVRTLKKLSSGYINGTRVALGTHGSFASTSTCTELAFLGDIEDGQPDRLDPEVSTYLEGCLGGGVVTGGVLGTIINTSGGKRGQVRRTPVAGAMKRTRSIILNLDASKELAKAMEDMEFEEAKAREEFIEPSMVSMNDQCHLNPPPFRARVGSASLYGDQEAEELVVMLKETRNLEDQGDILQYMVVTYGMQYTSKSGSVKQLVIELYDKACEAKHWGIVRHASGLLSKTIPNLALSLTDLIVRQKQVTVGLPPNQEVIISRPLGAMELRDLISRAHQGDISTSALTQEILCYLAMFIRTEPSLFHGMLRLRVGLIIQVMASELARTLVICAEEATDRLLNLSPFETKNLLHHIMSGQEYGVTEAGSKCSIISLSSCISRRPSQHPLHFHPSIDPEQPGPSDPMVLSTHSSLEDSGEIGDSRAGIWIRRRLLDGCLNRVPHGFYTRMWALLERCQGISVGGQLLANSLTQEMTSGEMKFHLRCEEMLNLVPEPELRQLVVEAILILILVVEYNVVEHLGGVIKVEDIVLAANSIFMQDQTELDGDATLCCLSGDPEAICVAPAGICRLFYDSAPSGTYGTMSYLVRAVCREVSAIPGDGDIDCILM